MNKRLVVVLAFALVISAAASFLLYQLLGARMTARASQPTSDIPVSRARLEIGAMIKESDLTTVAWPGEPPPNALLKKEEVVGRGVISAIYAGEPIRGDRLAPIGAGAGMAATIPVGMRALAIRVNDVVGVAGFVTPGMRVDLLILGSPNGQGTVSKTLLQNIEVLSAGQQIQKDAEGKPIPVPVVNLLLTPDQAEVVSLASNHAQIQLVLRNPLDKEAVKTKGALFGRLFSDIPSGLPVPQEAPVRVRTAWRTPPPAPAPEPKKPEPPLPNVVVEILHGGAKAQVSFRPQEAK